MGTRWVAQIIVLLTCVFLQANASALQIVLTHGVYGAQPIAVLPFAGEGKLSQAARAGDIVRNDLRNSGRFRVSTTATSNIAALRAQGVNSLVTGRMTPLEGHRYRVSFEIINTLLAGQPSIVRQQFTVTQKNLRALAHHISDIVYQQLTGDKGVFSTRIAYILVQHKSKKTRYQLEVSDMDGFHPHVLVSSSEPIMSPTWSPDGKLMAYVSFEHKRSHIETVELATGARQTITNFPRINGAPAWSPDGKTLALVLSKDGSPSLYLYGLTRHTLTRITRGPFIDTEPSWAPDGKSIVFTSDRGGRPQLYRLTLSDKSIQRLTYQGIYNARGSLTPNGDSLVYLHLTDGFYSIAMKMLTSENVTILTKSTQGESPSISPNGKMVLYASHYGGKGVLNIISTDGRVSMRLPSQEGNVQEPAWSPYLA